MICGFNDRFLPLVWNGSKCHTIRAGQRWRPGMKVHLFARVRGPKAFTEQQEQTAGQFLLFESRVTMVDKIVITSSPDSLLNITIDGVSLEEDELTAFLWRDGFRVEDGTTSIMQAASFWRKQLAARPFEGQVIYWDFHLRRNLAQIKNQPYMRALVEKQDTDEIPF